MSTEVKEQSSNRILKIVLILVIILILAGAGYAIALEVVRAKLTAAWKAAAEKHGITQFPERSVKTELEKLGFTDLQTLIKFSKALDDGNYTDAAMMWAKVKPILQKTNLGNIKELAGIAFGT